MDLKQSILLVLLAGCTASAEENTPPNFIVVSLDTLRADRLGAYGGPEDHSPNLDRFASESIVFEQTFAQLPETLFSHASLFTSRYPSELSTVDYNFEFPADVPTMAEVLSLYGYATGAAVAGGHLSPMFGLQKGFQQYHSLQEWGSLWHTMPSALEWLDAHQSQPFFLFLHGYDTHNRYLKPSPVGYLHADIDAGQPATEIVRDRHGTAQVADRNWYRRRRFREIFDLGAARPWSPDARAALASKSDPHKIPIGVDAIQHIRDIYDGAVSYADLQFGLFMADLAERKLLDNTWVIVLSDHGEELGDNGLFNHRLVLNEVVLRVPLMIRPPGGLQTGRRVKDVTALLDILPTVVELAGGQLPASIRGRSLAPALRGEPLAKRDHVFAEGVFREIAVVQPGGGFALTGISAHSPHLLQALNAKPADSSAYRSWGQVDKTAARAALIEWRSSLPPSPSNTTAPDPARIEMLRKKGYWGPQ